MPKKPQIFEAIRDQIVLFRQQGLLQVKMAETWDVEDGARVIWLDESNNNRLYSCLEKKKQIVTKKNY